MRLSDSLKAKRADLLDNLEKLSETAAQENRLFTAPESASWDATQEELRTTDAQLERQLAAEDLRRNGKGGQRVAVDDQGNRHAILRSADKLAARFPRRDGQPLNIAKAIKGVVTGNWSEADTERRAMAEGTLSAGGYTVPTELAAQWIDMARAQSVSIAAGAGTIPMGTATLRIAEIVGDVVPAFRPENVALSESDVVFGALDLKARLIGVVCRASLELISDSPMANEMIVASITGALGVAMDAAMLAGDGLVDATHDNPRGILNWPGVNAVAAVGTPTNYDKWLDAIHGIELANLSPTAVVDHPDTANVLRQLKTGLSGDQSSLAMPPRYAALSPFVTTGLAAGNSIVGDFTNALFGMREEVKIEATRVGSDALSKAQVLIRGYMRLDTGITRAKAFTKLAGITTT